MFLFRALGQIAGGMTCDLFKLWANDTEFSELLHLVTDLSGAIRPAMVRGTASEYTLQYLSTWR